MPANSPIIIKLLQQVNTTPFYNGTAAAGSLIKSATDSNGSITFTTANVQKNPSYICLNLTSPYGTQSLCHPGSEAASIPEINGHFGLKFASGPTSIPITVTLQGNMAGPQNTVYTGNIELGTNDMKVFGTGSGYTATNSFTYYIGEPLNITLDAAGNGNYLAEDPSFITPSGVGNVVNVSLDNQQSSAITAGTQVMLTFNGLNYTSYFNGNNINFEVFNGQTGNILYTWYEGNQSNELQSNSFNSVSNNIVWVTLPAQIAASTDAVNVLTIGFLGMSSSALNGNNVGLAPQLYCASAGNCPASSYGEYDTGANVFSYYQSWGGLSSLPSGWTGGNDGGQPSITYSATNTELAATGGSLPNWYGPYAATPTPLTTYPTVFDTLYAIGAGSTTQQMFGLCSGTTAGSSNCGNSNAYASLASGAGSCSGEQVCFSNDGSTTQILDTFATSPPEVYSLAFSSSTKVNVLQAYNSIYNPTISTAQSNSYLVYAMANPGTAYMYWSRARSYLPGGVMPTTTYGPVQGTGAPYTPPSNPTLTLSNTLIDQGQTITFTAGVSNGNDLFSYNYLVVNSITDIPIANMLHTGIASRSDTWAWTPAPNLYTSNTFKANVIISEQGAYSNSVNTVYTGIGYNALLTLSISPASSSIANGGSKLLTATETGGTSSFTYAWYTNFGTSADCTGSNGNVISGATSSTYTASPITSNAYCAKVTDSATTPTSNTATATITLINPPTISLANSITFNSMDVVIGSPSDNALITATCTTGDTCQIWKQGGTSNLATGTTTATLAYNALPYGTTGIYANDITNSITSNGVYNSIVRRLASTNSITITLTNNQGTVVSANTPLMITFNSLNFSGSYKTEISNTLNNTYFAFSNGTVAYSWLEGNLLNEQGNTNALINANEVVFWFKSPASAYYLPANSGVAKTNTIVLELDSPANSVWDGNFIGVAPQLSCQNPVGTATCKGTAGATKYAQWDNGKSVFLQYFNFSGTVMPTGIILANTISSGASASIEINNGIILSVTGSGNLGSSVGQLIQIGTGVTNNIVAATFISNSILSPSSVAYGVGLENGSRSPSPCIAP